MQQFPAVVRNLLVCWVFLAVLVQHLDGWCCWNGAHYWNSRYSSEGIDYTGGEEMWMSIWSVHQTSYWSNYYYCSSCYNGRTCNCHCDEENFKVQSCNGQTVTIRYYTFHNLTNETFSSNVQNIRIELTTDFTHIGNATFRHLSNLHTISIHRTQLRQLPDLEGTVVEKAMFGYNNITIFDHNHTNPVWPSTLTHLNLNDNDINYLPDDLFSGTNIIYLGLARNNIWRFPYQAVRNMSKIEYINLSENMIKSINTYHLAPLAFDLTPLKHLNLSNNEIYWIQPGGLATLTSLQILELDWNKFTRLPTGTFDNITKLNHLSLHHNEIQILHGDSFTDMEELLLLDVHSQNPGLTNIYYTAFRNINKRLRDLWVSDNNLQTFPHQVLSMDDYSALHSVWAEHNSINDPLYYGSDGFPPKGSTYETRKLTFEKWSTSRNIVRLWLGANGIPEISAEDFCELWNLQQLYLNNNVLGEDTTPTDAFKCVDRLRILSLASNRFEYMPTSVKYKENLPSLTHLYLQNNYLTFLKTDAISEIDTLLYLWISSNRILTMEDYPFPANLNQLWLQHNDFRFTHEQPFANLTNLRVFGANNNEITDIPINAFENNVKMTYVHLHNNQISRFMNGTFTTGTTAYERLLLNNNQLAYIEPGTFDHVVSITYFYFHDNRLTELPRAGDFHDLSASYLHFYNNRLTRVESDTFKRLSVSHSLNLYSNRIMEVEPYAFEDVTCGDNINLHSNLMRTLNTNSFKDTTCDTIQMQNMHITHLPFCTFNNVVLRDHLYLQNNDITYIENEAMDIYAGDHIYLNDNPLNYIVGKMFKDGSRVYTLYMYRQELKHIPVEAFVGLSAVHVDLRYNYLFSYPEALNVLNLQSIDVRYNEITELQLDDFVGQSQIRHLYFQGNALTTVPKGLLDPLPNLITFDFRDNDIRILDTTLFEGLFHLQYIYLSNNDIFFLDTFPNITAIDVIDLQNNDIFTLGYNWTTHINETLFDNLNLNNNPLSCDCHLWMSLNYTATKVSNGMCTSPTASPNLNGVFFGSNKAGDAKYFKNAVTYKLSSFLCSPVNVQAQTPSEQVIEVYWDPPNMIHVEAPDATATEMEGWTYTVTCDSELAGSVVGSVSNTTEYNITFTEADGVRGDTEYICTVTTTATVEGEELTSGKSMPAVITAIAPKVDTNVVIAVEDILLPIVYYDFTGIHIDFNNVDDGVTYSNPSYVPSPYGAWLSISNTPETDSYSDWYRKIATNYEFERQLILKGITSEQTNRFYSDAYFPLDGLGYGEEGQRDCNNDLHNFGFTSAIRTGFVFQGTENITIGGGDEIWFFLNRKLVFQQFTDPSETNMKCSRINLANAVPEGGGVIVVETGIIISGKCSITGVSTADPVEFDFDVDERYHFTVFHTERYLCKSNFFMETQGTDFILDPVEEPPRDYIAKIDEDYHLLGLVETMYLADTFSAGPPFQVNIIKGNEARHFDFKDNTAENQNLGVTPTPEVFTYTTVEGISFVECPDPIIKIPEQNETAIETFDISTDSVLAILKLEVDYEVATNYTVILEVVDYLKSPALTGTITLKVRLRDINDNCPIMRDREFYYFSDPSLQSEPILKGVATDEDSTINAAMTFLRNNVTEDPPVEYNTSRDLLTDVYTIYTNLSFLLIVTDGGVPTRGTYANITVEIHNTCLIDEDYVDIFYNFVIDELTGDIYLRIPGYWQEVLACNRIVGVEDAFVIDDMISASSSYFESKANRARLNMGTLPLELDGLTGGWVPLVNDQDQWLQLDMQVPYIFTELYIQGRDDLNNYVTSFYIWYKDANQTEWTKYNETIVTTTEATTTEEISTVAMATSNSSDDNATTTEGTTTMATTPASTVEPVDWALQYGNTDNNNITKILLEPRIYGQMIRINPQSWHGNISIRFDMAGCSQEENTYYWHSCQRCKSSWYCLGDGGELPCGRCEPYQEDSTCGRHPTEHSFGRYVACQPCPAGWLCHNGTALPCKNATYANCTEDWCPEECIECEPGFACRGGEKYECPIGTYSEGNIEYCDVCLAGTFQNQTGQTSCMECESGYYTSKMQSVCEPCEEGTYSDGIDGLCKACSSVSECPCMEIPPPCFYSTNNGSYTQCLNTGGGGHKCLACPTGFRGDGVDCEDINECAEHFPCWGGHCRNTVPGYQCGQCPEGYTGTFEDAEGNAAHQRVFEDACAGKHSDVILQQCEDIDECAVDNGRCDPNAYCHNTIGSFHCGICKPNWVGDAFYGCRPANFCASGEHRCHDHALCIYTGPGRYKCECNNGWAGDGFLCGIDPDQDGVSSEGVSCTEWGCRRDNCPDISNSGQEDNDNDKLGDVCDPDDDQDTIYDFMDNCPMTWNIGQWDADSDYVGDACDNCPNDANTDQQDVDNDGIGDACDSDSDSDGLPDTSDNCPLVANSDQADADGDSVGDACDNCVNLANSAQTDTNENDIGDACEDGDTDGDAIYNSLDNCVLVPNAEQKDTDGDGFGDACDHDVDGDGVHNDDDNCIYVANADQEDLDGNHVGDACDNDLDGDGIIDRYDNCPTNKFINTTDFNKYRSVNMYPNDGEDDVAWRILFDGQEIRQAAITNATAIFLGEQVLGDMDYRGTMFVNYDDALGYIGAVFGYQSNKKFYVALWRSKHYNWHDTAYKGGIKGLQIKRVDSTSGPSQTLARALWHSSTTDNHVTLLWQDPTLLGWETKVAYQWHIMHRPSRGTIRVLIKYEEKIIVDSGELYDTNISGGRVGAFVYAQPGAIFSKLNYECKESLNYALKFDGIDDYAVLSHIMDLEVNVSFTIETWVYLHEGYPTTKMPIVCNEVGTFCMYLEDGILHGTMGDHTAEGSTVMPPYSWTHLTYRYSAEDQIIRLYVNGTASVEESLAGVPVVTWGNETSENVTRLYLCRQGDLYFEGTLDETRIYSIYIPDDEIDYHWQTVGMFRENNVRYLSQHFDYDENPDPDILEDKSQLYLNGTLFGGEFKKSQSEMARFKNTYPSNRRRRSIRSTKPSRDELNGDNKHIEETYKIQNDIYDPDYVNDIDPDEVTEEWDREKDEKERLARYKGNGRTRQWRDRYHRLSREEVFPQPFIGPYNEDPNDRGGVLEIHRLSNQAVKIDGQAGIPQDSSVNALHRTDKEEL